MGLVAETEKKNISNILSRRVSLQTDPRFYRKTPFADPSFWIAHTDPSREDSPRFDIAPEQIRTDVLCKDRPTLSRHAYCPSPVDDV